jgi:hypothetical protein
MCNSPEAELQRSQWPFVDTAIPLESRRVRFRRRGLGVGSRLDWLLECRQLIAQFRLFANHHLHVAQSAI